MRTRPKILIGTMAFVLAMSAGADVITCYTTNTKARINNLGTAGNNFYVGQYNTSWVDRSYLLFELPDLAAGQTLVSATLRIFAVTTFAVTNDADLYHMQDLNHTGDLIPGLDGDYNAGTPTLAMEGLGTPTMETNRYYEVDVLSLIQSDYTLDSSDNRIAAFRIQLDNDDGKIHGGITRRYLFQSGWSITTNHPELVLETIPEPASVSLFLLSGLGIVLVRHRLRS